MGRHLGPKKKYARRFGLAGDESRGAAHESKHRSRKTEYGTRFEEKQKLKFIYGIREKELKHYVTEAAKTPGDSVPVLLRLLESRLDNVIFRLGFAKTRSQARQIVAHGHVKVNGRRVNIPSYEVKRGEKLELGKKMAEGPHVKEALDESAKSPAPVWLTKDGEHAEIVRYPAKDEVALPVDLQTVMDLYA